MEGDPAIILVSGDHGEVLLGEFQSRYQRDYDLRMARSAAEAEELAQQICDRGGTVAMFVSDSRLPDVEHVFEAIHRWRRVVPTSRRVISAHADHFFEDGPPLRGGLAKGKYDAYLLMPRGRRDEEFHNAITELLSDWTSTVPQPEVISAKVISPVHDSLTMAIRDFLDRMGMQNGLYHPDEPQLQEFMAEADAGGEILFLHACTLYESARMPTPSSGASRSPRQSHAISARRRQARKSSRHLATARCEIPRQTYRL